MTCTLLTPVSQRDRLAGINAMVHPPSAVWVILAHQCCIFITFHSFTFWTFILSRPLVEVYYASILTCAHSYEVVVHLRITSILNLYVYVCLTSFCQLFLPMANHGCIHCILLQPRDSWFPWYGYVFLSPLFMGFCIHQNLALTTFCVVFSWCRDYSL